MPHINAFHAGDGLLAHAGTTKPNARDIEAVLRVCHAYSLALRASKRDSMSSAPNLPADARVKFVKLVEGDESGPIADSTTLRIIARKSTLSCSRN
jgi:hypothetical protein